MATAIDLTTLANARAYMKLDPSFTIRRFSATVGVNPEVFLAFANAWREAGLPE